MAHSIASKQAAKLQLKRSQTKRPAFAVCRSSGKPIAQEQPTAVQSSAAVDRRSLLLVAGAALAAVQLPAPRQRQVIHNHKG